jgi:hypothetical protein
MPTPPRQSLQRESKPRVEGAQDSGVERDVNVALVAPTSLTTRSSPVADGVRATNEASPACPALDDLLHVLLFPSVDRADIVGEFWA